MTLPLLPPGLPAGLGSRGCAVDSTVDGAGVVVVVVVDVVNLRVDGDEGGGC